MCSVHTGESVFIYFERASLKGPCSSGEPHCAMTGSEDIISRACVVFGASLRFDNGDTPLTRQTHCSNQCAMKVSVIESR